MGKELSDYKVLAADLHRKNTLLEINYTKLQNRISELESRDGVVLLTQSSSEQSKQIEELKAENERLLGIMERDIKKINWPQFKEAAWEKFKTENNL